MSDSADAADALNVARKYLASRDYKGAERLCLKAQKIHTTAEGTALLSQIRAQAANPSTSTSTPKASTSAAEPSASTSGLKNRKEKEKAAPEQQKRDYTPDQLAHVKRIRGCKATSYYEILNIEKSCSDVEIKKAYRKHSLAVHPDKNGAPGSDEAFKLVSTAFQVLSEPDKRAHYDRYGQAPGERAMPSAGASPSFRRQGGFAGGGMGDEISPEDLFNMFFGGGGGFQGGFGGPGVRVHTFGGQPRRRAAPQAGQGAQGNTSTWVQLLPLILLFAFSFLTQLPSLLNPPAPDPNYTFDPYPASTGKYQIARSTQTHHIDYFLDENQLRSTKVWTDLLKQNPTLDSTIQSVGSIQLATLPNWALSDGTKLTLPRSLLNFEHTVEQAYVGLLQHRCENEQDYLGRRRQAAMGFFGLNRDEKKLEALKKEGLPSCDRLRQLGIRTRGYR